MDSYVIFNFNFNKKAALEISRTAFFIFIFTNLIITLRSFLILISVIINCYKANFQCIITQLLGNFCSNG